MPMRGSWLDAIILGGTFIFSVEGALMIFSACSPKPELALQAPLIYIMLMTYAGDTLRDKEALAAIEIPKNFLRTIARGGSAPKFFSDVMILILIGAICFALAIKKPPVISERLKLFSTRSNH